MEVPAYSCEVSHTSVIRQGRIKHLVGPTHFTMPGPNPSVDRRVRWMRRAPCQPGSLRKSVSCLPVNAALSLGLLKVETMPYPCVYLQRKLGAKNNFTPLYCRHVGRVKNVPESVKTVCRNGQFHKLGMSLLSPNL